MGLEPTTTGITIRDSTNCATVTTELLLFGSPPTGLACREGIEPPTYSLEGCCSIQLSYRQVVEACPRMKR